MTEPIKTLSGECLAVNHARTLGGNFPGDRLPEEPYIQPLRYRLARHAPIMVWARRLKVRDDTLHDALSGSKNLIKLYHRAQEMVEALENGEWRFFRARDPEYWLWSKTPAEITQRRLSARKLLLEDTGPKLVIPEE